MSLLLLFRLYKPYCLLLDVIEKRNNIIRLSYHGPLQINFFILISVFRSIFGGKSEVLEIEKLLNFFQIIIRHFKYCLCFRQGRLASLAFYCFREGLFGRLLQDESANFVAPSSHASDWLQIVNWLQVVVAVGGQKLRRSYLDDFSLLSETVLKKLYRLHGHYNFCSLLLICR